MKINVKKVDDGDFSKYINTKYTVQFWQLNLTDNLRHIFTMFTIFNSVSS